MIKTSLFLPLLFFSIWAFSQDKWKLYTPDNSNIQTGTVREIKIDQLNNKWLATGPLYAAEGLSKFNGTTFERYQELDSNFTNISRSVESIAIDDSNKG